MDGFAIGLRFRIYNRKQQKRHPLLMGFFVCFLGRHPPSARARAIEKDSLLRFRYLGEMRIYEAHSKSQLRFDIRTDARLVHKSVRSLQHGYEYGKCDNSVTRVRVRICALNVPEECLVR